MNEIGIGGPPIYDASTPKIGVARSYAASAVAHGSYARLCVACDRPTIKSVCYICKAPTVGREEARELCGCERCFPPFQPTRESLIRAALGDLEARLGFGVYEWDLDEAPR